MGIFSTKMSSETHSVKSALVMDFIKSDKIVIFSKTSCPYCKLAKEVFDKLNAKYTEITLENRDDGEAIQSILGEMTGARTVPRVFVNGKCIGGGSDVKALHQKGELQKMIQA
ncbi:unnamed protein product [Phaedon cochleariae]|uniref:Glutaredoxin-2, mitochondrial n=1 Tax=Phaedon cochleariae TaxID=80249 RepID=A0A9N9SFM9_PHACE|nr:unnamed protein product [Phaedon cochleariae]